MNDLSRMPEHKCRCIAFRCSLFEADGLLVPGPLRQIRDFEML